MINNIVAYFKDSFKNNKKKTLSATLLLGLGIMLLIFAGVGNTVNSEPHTEMTLEEYRVMLEGELEQLCSSVKGVGKCRVMVTFERGEENTYKGSSLVESKPPKVMGISVVCKGADSDKVKKELCELLTALFDIRSNRISVLKLN